MTEPRELLDPGVAERVLARALAHGGEFAEVFAERRGGLTLAIDESRISRSSRAPKRAPACAC